MKIFCGILIIIAAMAIYKVQSGGVSWPPIDETLPPHRYISFSSECIDISPEARAEAHETFIKLHEIQKEFDQAVQDNNNETSVEILQNFVTAYIEIEDEFIQKILGFFNVNLSDFITIIHKFGFKATGDLLCAYELFGEAVGDNIDFFEYCVKTLRHDLVGLSQEVDNCAPNFNASRSIETTNLVHKGAYNRVRASNLTDTTEYDHYVTAYNFVEIFEKSMWRLSDKLVQVYDLDNAEWRKTLIYNGINATGDYLCAYAAYYRAENTYVELYLKLLMDIIQRTKHFDFDYVIA